MEIAMPTAVKGKTEPRTVNGTGFWRRNDVARRINPATAKIAPPTRLYWRCAAAERAQSPDGVASDITPSPPSLTYGVSPAVTDSFPPKKATTTSPAKKQPIRRARSVRPDP